MPHPPASPTSTTRGPRLWWRLLLGFALLGLGVVSWLWLPRWLAGQPADDSAIPVAVDFPAPDFDFTTLDGHTHTLADFRGQVVLVNNWATWCPPCREEMPTLEAYYRAHKAQGFVLIALAAHEYPFEVNDFLQKAGWHLSFLIAPDPGEQAMTAFRQTHLPASYLIDRQGTVRLMWVGAISRHNLEKFVTPFLEK